MISQPFKRLPCEAWKAIEPNKGSYDKRIFDYTLQDMEIAFEKEEGIPKLFVPGRPWLVFRIRKGVLTHVGDFPYQSWEQHEASGSALSLEYLTPRRNNKSFWDSVKNYFWETPKKVRVPRLFLLKRGQIAPIEIQGFPPYKHVGRNGTITFSTHIQPIPMLNLLMLTTEDRHKVFDGSTFRDVPSLDFKTVGGRCHVNS